MSRFFEELDYQPTAIGPISLRRRRELRLNVDVLEIMLGDEHLMSDLFTTSEIALAKYGLDAVDKDGQLSVVVGGLGMGFTAAAVLEDDRIDTLLVVEKLSAVLDWHKKGLIPLGETLTQNPKVQLVEGDFFQLADGAKGFDPQTAARQFDAILLDIDHTPDFHLAASHAGFYQPDGLTEVKKHLLPKGIFALWSNEPPDEGFVMRLQSVFASASAVKIPFYNPLQDRDFVQSIYLAQA